MPGDVDWGAGICIEASLSLVKRAYFISVHDRVTPVRKNVCHIRVAP